MWAFWGLSRSRDALHFFAKWPRLCHLLQIFPEARHKDWVLLCEYPQNWHSFCGLDACEDDLLFAIKWWFCCGLSGISCFCSSTSLGLVWDNAINFLLRVSIIFAWQSMSSLFIAFRLTWIFVTAKLLRWQHFMLKPRRPDKKAHACNNLWCNSVMHHHNVSLCSLNFTF